MYKGIFADEVVIVGGHLVAFTKMDGAWLGSIDIAIKKAKTSALFGGLPTMQLGDLVRYFILFCHFLFPSHLFHLPSNLFNPFSSS